MPHRFARVAALVLLCLAGAPRAAELGFAHFAPGAGTVRVQVDDLPAHVLAYKDYDAVTRHDAGLVSLRATRADGSVLAEGTLDLRQNDRYIVIVAGNGTHAAPWQLRLATDHNHAFVAGQWSLQEANLAIAADPASGALAQLAVQDSCDGAFSPGPTEAFGRGTRSLTGTETSGSVSIRQVGTACVQAVLDPAGSAPLGEASFGGRSGERLRRFVVGDGVAAPIEVVLVNQGIDTVYPQMAPDASIEGLFAIDGVPNTGLQVTFDADAPPGESITAVYFGFENDGRASWRTVEKMRIVEYVGGNAEGTRAAVGFDRAIASIAVHTCSQLSMKVTAQSGPPSGLIFPGAPRNTVYLKRLFPPTCPPAVPNGQEVKP